MTTQTVAPGCPHCGEANPSGSAFCAACGKALPSAVPTGPRVVTADHMPTSAAGQKLVGDELKKQTNRAAYTLLAVGILQMTCGAIAAVVLSNVPGAPPADVTVLLIAQFVVAATFLGLYFWARTAPLPASIVGLVIYCTLLVLNVVTSVSELGNPDNPRRGIGGIGIGWLDIVIIVFLVQGIQAGLKHRQLLSSGDRAAV